MASYLPELWTGGGGTNLYAGIYWFHEVDLGNGVITPGIDGTRLKITAVEIPENLTGKTVLDIGAWDGAFSFECERRGATRVVAVDHYMWRRSDHGFHYAHKILNSKVERVTSRVEELAVERLGQFDLVLFLGVLYHAQDPMRYLRRVFSLSRGQVIIETHIDAQDYSRPAMVFYPGATLNNDASNFWGPNTACVELMLREVGFREVRFISEWQHSRAIFHAFA